MQIKHRRSDIVLYESDKDTFKETVIDAIRSRANLRGADLCGADLYKADLYGANLCGADLYKADLREADLYKADLYGANLCEVNLRGADLREVNLRGANLCEADLYKADLRGADLRGANLRGADLYEADLYEADLRGALGINKHHTTPLCLLLYQPGPIRACKLVKANGEGPYNGGLVYKVGQAYEVDNASDDENESCGAGINLATIDWCLKEWREGYRILWAEHTAEDIACIPIGPAGKYRVHRCTIVGEADLAEFGLVEPEKEGA